MILATFVRGSLVRIVIFSLGSSCSLIDCQTSKANGCRNSGWSVFLGAPRCTEFSAVYLNREQKIVIFRPCALISVSHLIPVKQYLLGLLGNDRASPYRVSESISPPLPWGIAHTYLQPRVGVPNAVVLPRPTGMSSRPIICKMS
jgi:hypothetical protein